MAANETITHGTEQSGEPKWRLARIFPVENRQSPLGYLDRSAAKRINMKPETCLIVGVVFYFATTAINRFLAERNYKSLSQEDKLKLTGAFSTHRSLATYIPIAIMVAVMAIGYANPSTFVVAFPIGVILVLVVSFTLQIGILRRLSELSLPGEYVSKFRLQSTVVQIGNVVALSMFAYGIVGRLG